MYEVYEDGIGGAQRVLARPELSEAEVAPQQSVFLPSGWWYVLKGAELKGVDLDTHIAAVFDRARLFRGDTFARLDAIEAARATLDTMPAEPPEGGVWVAGRATLGAYDLERRGWPLRGLNIVMPSRDRTEESIARRVGPEIVANDLVLPMPMDEARAFQEQQGSSGQLDFYARLDLSAPESASDLNVRGHLREMLLFPPSGSSSQRMQVSPAFDRSRAIASFEFPAEAGAAPAETLAAAAPVPVAAPAPAPAGARPGTCGGRTRRGGPAGLARGARAWPCAGRVGHPGSAHGHRHRRGA